MMMRGFNKGLLLSSCIMVVFRRWRCRLNLRLGVPRALRFRNLFDGLTNKAEQTLSLCETLPQE